MVPILTTIFRDNWEQAKEESDDWQLNRRAVIKNVKKIIRCKTLWLGTKAYKCSNEKCNHIIHTPNTCKSRFCPTCAFKASLNWQGGFLHRVIQSKYQHLIFSIPTLIKEIYINNRRAIVNVMYNAASKSILEYCEKRCGYKPGIVGVFHSFGKSLNVHPHFHLVRTAGGILLKDGKTWFDSEYLPEKAMKDRFKAKVLKGLRGLHRTGQLKGKFGRMDYAKFNKKLNRIHESHWWAWIGKADDDADLIPYLYIGRYLHRAPISSKRITGYLKGKYVWWLPKSHKKLPKTSAFRSTTTEFIEKIVVHMPDEYDHQIFYSGLYAPVYRNTLYKAAKEHFDNQQGLEPLKEHKPMKWAQLMEMAFGEHPLECPECGSDMQFIQMIFLHRTEIELFELKNYQIIERKVDSS